MSNDTNNQNTEERYLELLLESDDEATAAEQLTEELMLDRDLSEDEAREAVAEARTAASARDFLRQHPEFFASQKNADLLLAKARQLADEGEAVLLQDLEEAFYQISSELEKRPAPAPAEQPEPESESDHGIQHIRATGATLVVPAEVRKELAGLSLADLARRMRIEMAQRRSESRKLQVRQDGE